MGTTAQHETRCSVCKHEARADIEDMVRTGYSVLHVQREHGLPRNSVGRHCKHFGISFDVEIGLRKLIGAGMANLSTKAPSATNTIDAIKLFARITGKLDNKREIMAVMFPGKTEEQVAHWATTGSWTGDDAIQ